VDELLAGFPPDIRETYEREKAGPQSPNPAGAVSRTG
jgi:hypothetical protein